jgi:hypothetical protein
MTERGHVAAEPGRMQILVHFFYDLSPCYAIRAFHLFRPPVLGLKKRGRGSFEYPDRGPSTSALSAGVGQKCATVTPYCSAR